MKDKPKCVFHRILLEKLKQKTLILKIVSGFLLFLTTFTQYLGRL